MPHALCISTWHSVWLVSDPLCCPPALPWTQQGFLRSYLISATGFSITLGYIFISFPLEFTVWLNTPDFVFVLEWLSFSFIEKLHSFILAQEGPQPARWLPNSLLGTTAPLALPSVSQMAGTLLFASSPQGLCHSL